MLCVSKGTEQRDWCGCLRADPPPDPCANTCADTGRADTTDAANAGTDASANASADTDADASANASYLQNVPGRGQMEQQGVVLLNAVMRVKL